MKLKLFVLLTIVLFTLNASAQYTPLPALDAAEYERFVTSLRRQADKEEVPELKTVADNMTYEEARRFMANPYVFAEKLKNQEKKEGMDALEAVRVGIILKLLYSHLTGINDSYDSSPRLGYAFGLYAMFVLGTVYFMPELLFMQRTAAQKYPASQTTFENILTISYATLVLNMMYVIQGARLRWMLGGGPAFAFGLSGKEKFKDNNQTDEEKLEFGENGLRRFQAGLNLQIGVALASGFMCFLGYTFYFTKLFSDNEDYGMNTFRLGLAYLFAASKKGSPPEASAY